MRSTTRTAPLTDYAQVDYEDATAAVIRHDARDLPLPDDSVDLIVTSPPYFALRSYRDDGEHYDGQIGSEDTPAAFIDALIECTREWVRVLKPSGSLFVNLGDKLIDKSRMLLPHRYAIACIDQLGLIVRMDMVWSKPNGLPEPVTDRVRASHEYWFHVVKAPRYFSGLDEIRETNTGRDGPSWDERKALGEPARYGDTPAKAPPRHGASSFANNPLGRVPGSVWDIPSEPLIVPDDIRQHRNLPDHFAAFPQEWPRRLILGFSPTGICVACGEPRRAVVSKSLDVLHTQSNRRGAMLSDDDGLRKQGHRAAEGATIGQTVATITGYVCACPPIGNPAPTRPAVILDPFGGTGTVAGVARTLGRYGISNDLSADYNRLAMWRIWESGHFGKSEQRTWRDRQGAML